MLDKLSEEDFDLFSDIKFKDNDISYILFIESHNMLPTNKLISTWNKSSSQLTGVKFFLCNVNCSLEIKNALLNHSPDIKFPVSGLFKHGSLEFLYQGPFDNVSINRSFFKYLGRTKVERKKKVKKEIIDPQFSPIRT